MTSTLLTLIWIFLPLCWLTVGYTVWENTPAPFNWMVAGLLGISLFCWIYLTARMTGFRQRLLHFLSQLLKGDYETGIHMGTAFRDEFYPIEDTANRLVERLRIYDRLRADRVSIHARVLDLILRQVKEPLITADVEKEVFVFNPAAQKALGIERKSFSFESVLKPAANQSFHSLFKEVVSGRKVNTEGTCLLQLPGMHEPLRIGLELLPLRDRDEIVRFAVLSLTGRGTGPYES